MTAAPISSSSPVLIPGRTASSIASRTALVTLPASSIPASSSADSIDICLLASNGCLGTKVVNRLTRRQLRPHVLDFASQRLDRHHQLGALCIVTHRLNPFYIEVSIGLQHTLVHLEEIIVSLLV